MKKLPLTLTLITIISVAGCGTSTPQVVDEYVHCRSLAGDRTALKLFAWEFDAVVETINAHCPVGSEMEEQQILATVCKKMHPELRDSLKDAESSIRTALHELEVRGVYTRVPDSNGGPSRYRHGR